MAIPHTNNKAKYDALVISVAAGVSISEWCRKGGVPRSTVDQWTSEPTFTADVEARRREMLVEAIGKFTAAVGEIAEGMIGLARGAESEATKLAAQRAVMGHLVELTEFAELKKRLDAVERRLDAERDPA